MKVIFSMKDTVRGCEKNGMSVKRCMLGRQREREGKCVAAFVGL